MVNPGCEDDRIKLAMITSPVARLSSLHKRRENVDREVALICLSAGLRKAGFKCGCRGSNFSRHLVANAALVQSNATDQALIAVMDSGPGLRNSERRHGA